MPEHAPYDRIIVTAGAWDIPPVWVEQLADGGCMVVKLRMWGLARSLSSGRDGNRLVSWLAMLRGFVAMQGTGAGAATAARRPPRRGGRPQARRCGSSRGTGVFR